MKLVSTQISSIIFSRNSSRVIAAAFVLAFVISFNPKTLASGNNQNIDYTFTVNAGSRCTDPGLNPAAHPSMDWTVNVTNHGPGTTMIVGAVSRDPIAGCAPTTTAPGLGGAISGKTVYAVGESGQAMLHYDATAQNCGRVQLDAGFRDPNGNDLVFFGVVVNYGQDCGAPTPVQGTIEKTVRNITAGQSNFAKSVTASPGDTVEFQIKVNVTAGNAQSVVVTDVPPSQFSYVAGSLKLDGNSAFDTNDNLNIGNMAAGSSHVIVFRENVAGASAFSANSTTLVNTASAKASNSGSVSDSASVIVNKPAVVITPTCTTGTVVVNSNINSTWTLTRPDSTSVNSSGTSRTFGDQTLGNYSVQFDDVSGYTKPSAVSGTLNGCGTLTLSGSYTQVVVTAPCTTGTVTVNTNIASSGTITKPDGSVITWSGANSKTLTGQPAGSYTVRFDSVAGYTTPNSLGGTLPACSSLTLNGTYNQIVIQSLTPVISINKTVRNTTQGQSVYTKSIAANPGDQVQFQIQVSSTGTDTVQNVVVNDTMPSNLIVNSGSTSVNLGNMIPGSTQTINIFATVSSSSGNGNWINTATATSSNAGTVSDQATVVVNSNNTSAQLSLTKEVRNVSNNSNLFFSSSTSAAAGDRLEYRLTVRNNSLVNYANNVRVTDFLPSGINYIPGSFQIDGGTNYGNLFNGSQYLGNLFGGQSRTITYRAAIASNVSGSTLINSANASADNTQSVNASATVFISSIASGNIDLVLSKRAFNQTQGVDATVNSAKPDDLIIYTLSVSNRGNATATSYQFSDDLSNVLQLSHMDTFGDATFNIGNLSLVWPSVSIAAGSTAEKTFAVRVNQTFAANSGNVMTNTFGSTINIRVQKGLVKGTVVAPPTGTTSTFSLIFAGMTVMAVFAIKRREILYTAYTRIASIV
jgi:uncharacterized repeat protein (TIGR01451 family)/fimbrial isopeptide formation D2 family protein